MSLVVAGMKCKNCKCCKKGLSQSKPEAYVCIGVKVPFVIDDINHDCTEYDYKAASNKVEVARCPYCDESYYQELYSTTTCLYSPRIYKDGELISKDPNTTRAVCQCLVCGKEFSYIK